MNIQEQCTGLQGCVSTLSKQFERLRLFLMASEHPEFPLSEWIAATPEEQEEFQLEKWIAQQTGAAE
jgi:hypothetical protein